LVDEAYIDLFLAGVDGARIYWPWRMAKKRRDSLGRSYRNACEVYWVDSAIQDSDYGNQNVLDDAHDFDAEAVLLADTMGNYDETVKSLKAGLDLVDDHAFDGEVIIPLQAPYDECYTEFAGESEIYAIGGLNQATTDAPRIKAAKDVRALAGDGIHLHGLGWGPRDELAKAIHENPDLIDSIDYSTPIQSAESAMPGDEHLSVWAMGAAERLIRDLRKVSPCVNFDPDPIDLRDDGQAGLGDLKQ